jgi:phosphoglycerate dehydrogenase-like enzyme
LSQNPTVSLFTIDVPDQALAKLGQEFPSFEFIKSTTKEEALQIAERVQILVAINASKEIIARAKNCRWIQCFSAGVEDFLEIDEVRNNPNLLLTNASGVHGIPISEHIFAMLLGLTRNLNSVIKNQSKKRWVGLRDERPTSITELYGKNMLVAGLGAIGLETAKKAKSFGMKVYALKRNPSQSPKDSHYSEYVDRVLSKEDLTSILSQMDVVVDALPITSETQGFFDSNFFSEVKPGAIFVNIGRGKTVRELDMILALKSGKLGGACLDVFEEEPLPANSPLWDMSNVIVSPHIAGWTPKYFERAFEILEENLRRYSNGDGLLNLVRKNLGY